MKKSDSVAIHEIDGWLREIDTVLNKNQWIDIEDLIDHPGQNMFVLEGFLERYKDKFFCWNCRKFSSRLGKIGMCLDCWTSPGCEQAQRVDVELARSIFEQTYLTDNGPDRDMCSPSGKITAVIVDGIYYVEQTHRSRMASLIEEDDDELC